MAGEGRGTVASRIACAGHSVQMAGAGDRRSQQPDARCLGGRCGARPVAELGPYVRHVAVHGVRADHDLPDYLAVVQPCATGARTFLSRADNVTAGGSPRELAGDVLGRLKGLRRGLRLDHRR
jgi:hypothetical protein